MSKSKFAIFFWKIYAQTPTDRAEQGVPEQRLSLGGGEISNLYNFWKWKYYTWTLQRNSLPPFSFWGN